MLLKEATRELTLRQREGRAINAVAELLRRKLSVPNIYLEPPQSLISADVLAVDHGGAGDLHAVEIKLDDDLKLAGNRKQIVPDPETVDSARDRFVAVHRDKLRREKIRASYQQLMAMPAHYRYLVISVEAFDAVFEELGHLGLFLEDGIGRLGVITIKDRGEESPTAEIAVAPERFRVDPAKLKAVETRLLAKSRPDIEVRI
jgi:hypothetical protein